MSNAIFPGSFDPPTYGHLNLIQRSAYIFEHLHVVVAINPQKRSFFSEDERIAMMQELCRDLPNVTICTWDTFVVEYARNHNIHIIIRGVRPLSDFALEFEQALYNHQLNDKVETLFMPSAGKYSILRSSALKEIALLGGDISSMAPSIVTEMMQKKMESMKNSTYDT
ncbi:pantetheine-phosphate adenylyltransferase [Entomospira nematocerorum]|uniref:Phosphopantetheine adenylyltransferase n=1 Tax=Entomospira nematocerorum TaxID=2719987 RepID=A0A968GGS9_9SPIO|nr:pantetheine-phosphate adenylyltransferase [Entomospira nematocera]NIZ46866.1 pantetheine-phosphate adenylyltransferase [Entomospira nematocera]WDI33335.1 pantetheine-phosphate adenylyltransferase [Entomospira nematocera]